MPYAIGEDWLKEISISLGDSLQHQIRLLSLPSFFFIHPFSLVSLPIPTAYVESSQSSLLLPLPLLPPLSAIQIKSQQQIPKQKKDKKVTFVPRPCPCNLSASQPCLYSFHLFPTRPSLPLLSFFRPFRPLSWHLASSLWAQWARSEAARNPLAVGKALVVFAEVVKGGGRWVVGSTC